MTAVAGTARTHSLRTDIEALRALAVSMVLVFHAFPQFLAGGFVGVDVFFVVSGYLIITQLVRSAEGDRFGLVNFWVRRAWRLLPMAYLVLGVTLLATVLLAPRSMWRSALRELVASTFYVQNWYLYQASSDYTAADNGASPFQHFWSLSIEEQLYILTPLLVLGLLGLVGSRRIARFASWGLLAVTALSLGFALGWEPQIQGRAYYSSATRVWEFGIGGLLGLVGARVRGRAASIAFWGGVVLALMSSIVLDESTRFPGEAALLPVLGTAAALAGGRDARVLRRLIEAPLVQRLGGISYAVYLWHWPVLVLLAIFLEQERLDVPWAAGGIALSIALGWISRPMERRLREVGRHSGGRRLATATLLTAALASGALVGASEIAHRQLPDGETTARHIDSARNATGPCFGAAAMANTECRVEPQEKAVPDPATASSNNPYEECKESFTGQTPRTCEFGREGGTRVAVVGDSHAQRLLPALKEIAIDQDWHITTYLKASCPFTGARPVKYEGSCVAWNSAVTEQLVADPPEVVIAMSSGGLAYHKEQGETDEGAGAKGLAERAKLLDEAGIEVIGVVDNPQPGFAGIDPPACVLSGGGERCDASADAALRPDLAREASALSDDVHLLDLTDLFCRDDRCPAVIGGVLVYRDGQHVIDTYAESMAPFVHERLLGLSDRLS